MINVDNVSLGLWVDDKRRALEPDFMKFVGEVLRFDLIALMIDPSDKAWNPNWSAKDVERICKAADPYAIEIVLTTWPYPDKAQIDAMAKDMRELLGVGPLAGWETDQEFNWRASKVNKQDFPARVDQEVNDEGVTTTIRRSPYDLAGDYLVKVKKEVCSDLHCRNEMTTFTEHPENSQMADVAPHCDLLLAQAYSVSERRGRPISFDGRYGVGRMQRRTLERTMSIPGVGKEGGPELGVGHAAWAQRFQSAPAALRDVLTARGVPRGLQVPFAAMEGALALSVDEFKPVDHRWWSSKHIYGLRSNPYAVAFLRSLRGGLYPHPDA